MWTCYRTASAGETFELRLLGAFKRAHRGVGAPADVAVFRVSLGGRGAAYYFSPAATNVAASAMSEMGLCGGPVACEKPARVAQQIFGSADDWLRIFGEEPARR